MLNDHGARFPLPGAWHSDRGQANAGGRRDDFTPVPGSMPGNGPTRPSDRPTLTPISNYPDTNFRALNHSLNRAFSDWLMAC